MDSVRMRDVRLLAGGVEGFVRRLTQAVSRSDVDLEDGHAAPSAAARLTSQHQLQAATDVWFQPSVAGWSTLTSSLVNV